MAGAAHLRNSSSALLAALLTPVLASCSPPSAAPVHRPTKPPSVAAPLALTPPMGFNNWNAFGCDVNEALIKETADFFVASGLKDAGYRYVNIDDCWSLRERGPDGRLVPDPAKFPSGIRGVADYVHALGLELGLYGDAGTKTCAGYPGSLGKEELDARTFAEWGVDYLKYDNCYNQSDGSRDDFVRRYSAMRRAIDQTGRPIVYSICEWGQSKPWEWAAGIGHLWRTTGDISDSWASVRSIIAFNAQLAPYAGPGRWNDPDMLEIGNGGMSPTEYRTHMSLWAMMAAPLIIGTDLRKASPETLSILGRREIIALDQDPLGQQAVVVADDGGRMVFAKPLDGGDVAVALYNSTDSVAAIDIAAKQAGLPEAPAYELNNLWTDLTMHSGPTLAAGVPAHGTVVYRVSPRENPGALPPSLSVAGELGTLIPSVPGGTTLTARAIHRGLTDATAVSLAVRAPDGWLVEALEPPERDRVGPGDTLTARFNVTAPAGLAPGNHSLSIVAKYSTGERGEPLSVVTELVAPVVVPPPDGIHRLSELALVGAENSLGPVERDQANGAAAEGDGNLIAIGGKVYTRGLGTSAPSEVAFYLGGRCSALTTDVGIDDEATTGSATFKVLAGGRVVAESGLVRAGEPPRALSAKLAGAEWLKLVTEVGDTSSGTGAPANWADPRLTCGKGAAPARPELVLYSFESGSDGVGLSKPEAGGSCAPSNEFHTDGASGLEVTSPADGNWFGKSFTKPVDLSRQTRLAFDVRTAQKGTVGELAVEVGPDKKWCQGGHWAWANPNTTKTFRTAFKDLHCPAGVTLDQRRITGVWVFVKDGTFVIDQVRAE